MTKDDKKPTHGSTLFSRELQGYRLLHIQGRVLRVAPLCDYQDYLH